MEDGDDADGDEREDRRNKKAERTNKETTLEQTKIFFVFPWEIVMKAKILCGYWNHSALFLFFVRSLHSLHSLSVVFAMETITANILKKQSNFITTFRRHIFTNKTVDMHIGANGAAREGKNYERALGRFIVARVFTEIIV